MDLKSKIRTIPDWPKKGIMFRDITTLLKDPEGFKECINNFVTRYKNKKIDLIVGIEARGFIIGGAIAHHLGVGFIPIRKQGKLCAEVEKEEYSLEYGTDIIEIHKDAIIKGQKVILADDLLATGGTALAAAKLIKKLGGKIEEIAFIIDLPDLGGGKKLIEAGYSIYHQISFEGE